MTLIELSAANVVLGGRAIFEQLDFAPDENESVSVVGANGEGKTTFLRLLSGELWPVRADSRIYNFAGQRTWSPIRAREQMALVSPLAQERAVRLGFDGIDGERGARLTARECVATGLFDSFLLHQQPAAQQWARVDEWLARFEILDLAARDVGTLSQGQLRRVLLARALVKNPRLVLLDEAASGLDGASRASLFGLLEILSKSGTTFVFASHRREELPDWTTKWKLQDGRIEREENLGAAPLLTNEQFEGEHEVGVNGGEPLFRVRNAMVWLDGHAILRGLNFEWPRGVHLRVVGANGSGKSTFLRLLGGELSPARGGTIERLGVKTPRSLWHWRQRIALLSPLLQARFHENIPVRDAVASGLTGGFVTPRTLSLAQHQALEQMLDEWDLREWETRRFDRLSTGQTRRVLLARAGVSSPEVVLLDEALDGLDRQTRELCVRNWATMARGGTHFAFASHHNSDFPPWTNAQIVFENGRLLL